MKESEIATGGSSVSSGEGAAEASLARALAVAVKRTPGPPEEAMVWSPEMEACLFRAMLGHNPFGVNGHFHKICIRDKFSQNIGRQISSEVIWDHLSTLCDVQALHESEILPFRNSENFILPGEIIQEAKEGKVVIEDEVKEEIKEELDLHTGTEDEIWEKELRSPVAKRKKRAHQTLDLKRVQTRANTIRSQKRS